MFDFLTFHKFLSYFIILILGYAAVIDIATRTVSNKIISFIFIFGLFLSIMQNTTIEIILISMVVFCILLFCWNFGWLGGGDVKLISVSILSLAPGTVVTFVAAVSLSGGVLAAAYGVGKKIIAPPQSFVPVTRFFRIIRIEWWRIYKGGSLPYVCAIFAGYLYSAF